MKELLVSLMLLAGTLLLAQTPTPTPTPAPTYSVKLSWTPPASATGIASYVLYDRTSATVEISVAKPPANGQFVVVQLGVGMHRLTMATVSTAGEESARSNEARITLPPPAAAPTGVAVSP